MSFLLIAKKAGAEIVKQSSNAPLSGLLYSILQVLDEEVISSHIRFEMGKLTDYPAS